MCCNCCPVYSVKILMELWVWHQNTFLSAWLFWATISFIWFLRLLFPPNRYQNGKRKKSVLKGRGASFNCGRFCFFADRHGSQRWVPCLKFRWCVEMTAAAVDCEHTCSGGCTTNSRVFMHTKQEAFHQICHSSSCSKHQHLRRNLVSHSLHWLEGPSCVLEHFPSYVSFPDEMFFAERCLSSSCFRLVKKLSSPMSTC